jgi:hypothetical protein
MLAADVKAVMALWKVQDLSQYRAKVCRARRGMPRARHGFKLLEQRRACVPRVTSLVPPWRVSDRANLADQSGRFFRDLISKSDPDRSLRSASLIPN